MRPATAPTYLNLDHGREENDFDSDFPISRNWYILARISSSLILLGILALPPLLLPLQSLSSANKTPFTVISLAAITAGISLSPLLCFAIRDARFRFYSVLIPSLQSCGIGFVALIYYIGVYRDASYSNTAAALSISLTAAAFILYTLASVWTYRSVRPVTTHTRHHDSLDINSKPTGAKERTLSGRRSQSNGRSFDHHVRHPTGPYHGSSLSNGSSCSGSLWHIEPTVPASNLNSGSHGDSAAMRRHHPSTTSTKPDSPVGEVYGEGEAPVIKVTGAPRGIEEEEMRAQMARLLMSGEGKRVGESTFRIELPRNKQLERRESQTFKIELPRAFMDENVHGQGSSTGPRVQILGPLDSDAQVINNVGNVGFSNVSGLRPSGGRRAMSEEQVDSRLSWQRTPVEMTAPGRPPFARALSREDRRLEIEQGIRLR